MNREPFHPGKEGAKGRGKTADHHVQPGQMQSHALSLTWALKSESADPQGWGGVGWGGVAGQKLDGLQGGQQGSVPMCKVGCERGTLSSFLGIWIALL